MTDERALNRLLWLVAIGFFMQSLDTTIVNTALPAMAQSLGESPLRMQSVVVAYSLTMAMLIPASGWLADRFGTRRVFLTAIIVFAVGSLACASSRTLLELVIARVVQGVGGAMLLPVGRLAILHTFPGERLLQAVSFVAMPGLVGPLIGPTLGGWLVEEASWHWVFLINVPVGAIGCAATWAYMIDSRGERPAPFDLKGYVLLAFGMVAVSLALDGLAELGMKRAIVSVLILFGLSSLAAYWLHAVRTPGALFSPRLFKVHSFGVGILGNLFARIGSSSMPFLIPLLLQISLGYSPVQAGTMMLPVAAAAIAMKRVVTLLIVRAGYRNVLVGNTLLLGAAIASFSLVSPDQPVWLLLVQLAVFGALNSLQFTAMNTLTLKDLDRAQASGGNGLLSVVMMLAMSLGVATAGALLAAFNDVFEVGTAPRALPAFHATFLTVGLITAASSWIFGQLSANEERKTEKKDDSVEIG